MKFSKDLMIALLVTSVGLTFGMPKNTISQVSADTDWPTSLADCEERFERISFCHATHAENNPYNFHYNQPCEAAFGSGQGNSGHFEEDGTPAAGHEFPEIGTADFFTDDEDNTCGGEIEPTPTPETNQKVSTIVLDPSCESNTVSASVHVQHNNVDQSGVRVVFRYVGQEKIAYTGNDGKASVGFNYTVDGHVEILPDGFPTKLEYITKETNCKSTPGTVLGATTQGQVLGATTYAETGIVEDVMMSILGLAGASLFATGSVLHVKNKA